MTLSNNYYDYKGKCGHVRIRITRFERVSHYDLPVNVDTASNYVRLFTLGNVQFAVNFAADVIRGRKEPVVFRWIEQ